MSKLLLLALLLIGCSGPVDTKRISLPRCRFSHAFYGSYWQPVEHKVNGDTAIVVLVCKEAK